MSLNSINLLKVLHDDNSVFADLTNDAADYARDTFSITFTQAQDFIYIGYTKPINAVYPDMTGTLATASTTRPYWSTRSPFNRRQASYTTDSSRRIHIILAKSPVTVITCDRFSH